MLDLRLLSVSSHVTWNGVAERGVAQAHGEPGQHVNEDVIISIVTDMTLVMRMMMMVTILIVMTMA